MPGSLGKIEQRPTDSNLKHAKYLRGLLTNNCFHLHLHVNTRADRSFRIYGVRVRQREIEVEVCIKGETEWWRVGYADEIHQR